MDFCLTGLLVMILLAVSGFFSMAETALTSVSRPKMLGLSQEGDLRAAIVNELLAKQDRLIGTLLLGNNLINILASAITTEFMLDAFGKSGIAIATGTMTVLVLVFAEVLPKSYALNQADNVSLKIAGTVRAIYWLLLIPTSIVSWVVRRIAALFGVDFSKISNVISAEELRGAIEMHRSENESEGQNVKHERVMLRSVLELADVTVEQVMTHRRNMDLLDAALPVEELIDKALVSQYTRLPLYQDEPENIVGVLHTKLLVRHLRAHEGDRQSIDIMASVSEPWFIPETTTLFDQLQAFRGRKEHFGLVVDEYGALLGLVTREDILEEIVGNMSDDAADHSLPGVKHEKASNSFVVDGATTIRELNREFEWSLPHNDYATVAGLVLYEAQALPEVGQSFTFYNFRFDILERQRHQITSVRITPLEKTDDAS